MPKISGTSKARPLDVLLKMKDAGLVATTAVAQVGGSARIVTVGEAELSANEQRFQIPGIDGGRVDMVCMVNVSAMEVATGDEVYTILLEGSNTSDFSADVAVLAALHLGDPGSIIGADGDETNYPGASTGLHQYEMLFTNEKGDVKFKHLRLKTVVDGTIATGINYEAYITLL